MAESQESELEAGRMPFLQHLAELRDRVRNDAIAFVLAFLVCWYFSKEIFDWLCAPLFNIWNQHCDAVVNGIGDGATCVGHCLIKAVFSDAATNEIYTG